MPGSGGGAPDGRRARAEEQERQELLEWLASAVERSIPWRDAAGDEAKAA